MNLATISDTLTEQLNALDVPVFTLAAAALAFGFVMATVPKSLKAVALAYGVAMAFVISQHQMHYLYYGIVGGFAAALVFRMLPSGQAKKA